MDDLLPLDKNSAEFQAVFGSAADSASVAGRLNTANIMDDVVRFINADPILREDVYAYYLTRLDTEQWPGTSGTYRSNPVSITTANVSGQFANLNPSNDKITYFGTVQIATSEFADAIKFVTTLSHELAHFIQRYVNYEVGASNAGEFAAAYLKTEAFSHLRQAQSAESIQALGEPISAADQGEVAFLVQERARINTEHPTASGDERQELLTSAFLVRLSQPIRPRI